MVLNIEINAGRDASYVTVLFTLAVESIILDRLLERSLITEYFVKKIQVLYVKFFRLAKHILQPQTSKFRLTLRI